MSSFRKYYEDGTHIRNRVNVDCSEDKILVEQSHKEEVDINNIVRRHGIDLLQKVAALQQPQWDEVPGNDFQESMLIITKAQQTFEKLPSKIRKQFNNNPGEFLDYVQNPDNQDGLVDLGLATRKPVETPIEVKVVTEPEPETPPA